MGSSYKVLSSFDENMLSSTDKMLSSTYENLLSSLKMASSMQVAFTVDVSASMGASFSGDDVFFVVNVSHLLVKICLKKNYNS